MVARRVGDGATGQAHRGAEHDLQSGAGSEQVAVARQPQQGEQHLVPAALPSGLDDRVEIAAARQGRVVPGPGTSGGAGAGVADERPPLGVERTDEATRVQTDVTRPGRRPDTRPGRRPDRRRDGVG